MSAQSIRLAASNADARPPAKAARPATTRSSLVCLLASSLIGIIAYLYPFFIAPSAVDETMAHAADAPLLFGALLLLIIMTLSAEVHKQAGGGREAMVGAKLVALLGVLVAINSALRLLPSFAGASPVFLLIILVGYAYGPALGYLMGSLTLFVSAVMTGGIGPWLPYQMLGAGWMGMTCGWLPDLRRWPRAELLMLVVAGLGWGLLYGAILNLWFWPFVAPATASNPGDLVLRYAVFYVVTSLAFDAARSVAIAVMLLALTRPLLRVLRRFQRRFTWQPLDLARPDASL